METIQYHEEGMIATAVVSRPEAMNALNQQVLADLETVLQKVEANSGVRVLILTGAGEKAFVAGADIKQIDQLAGAQAAEAFASQGQKLLGRIESLRVPVVAAVNGFALGGGLELALACDFILASKNAKFGLPECTLGIMPGYGGTVRLPRRVGVAMAREMAYSGGFYSAEQALAMGLVNRVVEFSELMPNVRELASQIASRAPVAISKIKRSMQEGMRMEPWAHMALEARLFGELFQTQDQKEGTRAFIEKRKPSFMGK